MRPSPATNSWCGSRRGGTARSVIIAVSLGALLAVATLVAVSCQSPSRVVAVDALGRERAARANVSVAPAEAQRVRDEPLVRVRIRKDVAEASLDRAGPWVVAQTGARLGEIVRGPVRVVASGGGIRLVDPSGRVTGFPPGTAVFAAPHAAADGSGTVRVDGVDYPGTLRLVPSGGNAGTLDVINVVEIEDYLPGVISKELVPGWHETAFRVQAVAARTFALQRRERARKAGRDFDLESTTSDQVYGGTTGMGVAHSAVAATRGIVLIDTARLGTAYYSSTCGGRPALPQDIWPSADARITPVALAEPPGASHNARAILCQDAPLFRWSAARRNTELAARIAAWAEANRVASLARMRSIADIRATEINAAGRPIRFSIADQRGEITTLTGEQLRIACNFDVPGLPELTKSGRVYSNDLAFEIGPQIIRIEGRGFGHGVGMCQYCAQGMARRGDHWRDILAAFYPKYETRRVY